MFLIMCVQSCQEATSMIVKKPMYPSLHFFTVTESSVVVCKSSNLAGPLTNAKSIWYACPGIYASSFFDLLPLLFTIFAFSQYEHLKNGVFVGSSGIPLVHFLVSMIALVEECPICWCHSLRSFICWESFDGRLVVNRSFVVGAGVYSDGSNTGEVAIDSIGMVVAVS